MKADLMLASPPISEPAYIYDTRIGRLAEAIYRFGQR